MDIEMVTITYLHDVQTSINTQAVAANRYNIDLTDNIEHFLASERGKKIITIDDGYRSSKNIIPLIEKYEVECILFVTTGFVDKLIYPYEVKLSNFLADHELVLDFNYQQHSIQSYAQKEEFFKSIHKKLKPLSYTHRENHISKLFDINETSGAKYQYDVFLDWEDISDLDKHPLIEIGSHTEKHLYLPSQSSRIIYGELMGSKKTLEHHLSRKVTKVSYPYGGSSNLVMFLSRIAGYQKGYCTSKPGKLKTDLNIARFSLPDIYTGAH